MSFRSEFSREYGDVKWATGKLLGGIVLLVALVCVIGYAFSWCGQTAAVVQDEFGPRAALAKYSWFKDAAAQLDKKAADIRVYQGKVDRLQKQYDGTPRAKWARIDAEQLSVWESEVAGVKASYNSLAAEYNAEHAKFHWAFADVGKVPAGGAPLPREYRQYVDE